MLKVQMSFADRQAQFTLDVDGPDAIASIRSSGDPTLTTFCLLQIDLKGGIGHRIVDRATTAVDLVHALTLTQREFGLEMKVLEGKELIKYTPPPENALH